MISTANIFKIGRLAAWLAFMACSANASAATFDSYRVKVESARTSAMTVEIDLRNNDASSVAQLVAQLRRDFGTPEQIEWQGALVESSNDWLLERAANLESSTNIQSRLLNVVEIREHLSSVAFKLQESAPTAAATTERTKDEDKQKLAEILRREEFQKPQPQTEESVFQRWFRVFMEWLESIFPKPSPSSSGSSVMGAIGAVLRVLLFILLAGLVAFIVYKLAMLISPGSRRATKAKKKSRVILGEQIDEDQSSSDLFGEAERLAREGNLRSAIRKGYIALLCELSDRKVIGIARNKTNRDYLREVRSRTTLHPKMEAATDTFERHWYGSQDSVLEDWVRFRDEYDQAIRSV